MKELDKKEQTKSEPMRSISQLLKIVLEELEHGKQVDESIREWKGLCALLMKLVRDEKISRKEENFLYDYFYKHRPTATSVGTLSTFWHHRTASYFFTPGKITPRIHYVKWLIKKNEKSL